MAPPSEVKMKCLTEARWTCYLMWYLSVMMMLLDISSQPTLHGHCTHVTSLSWLALLWTSLVLTHKSHVLGSPRVPGKPGQLVNLSHPIGQLKVLLSCS